MKKILFLFLRKICRFISDFDGFFTTYTSRIFKTRYKLIGECNQCGVCCTKIAIYLSNSFWQYPMLKKFAINWYSFTYNFTFVWEEEDLRIIVFKCNYLNNSKCGVYKKRPYICRNYPLVRYFEEPIFLPECGFKTVCR
ncbi:MAG: YkgJ family cysteine cluster protein [Candidatus Margulisiibacteriota bacterium]|jgi:Fe-S-cluster containining protein